MNEYIASLFIAARPPYAPQPHRPRIASTEAKRQRRAKRRAIDRRRLRALKAYR